MARHGGEFTHPIISNKAGQLYPDVLLADVHVKSDFIPHSPPPKVSKFQKYVENPFVYVGAILTAGLPFLAGQAANGQTAAAGNHSPHFTAPDQDEGQSYVSSNHGLTSPDYNIMPSIQNALDAGQQMALTLGINAVDNFFNYTPAPPAVVREAAKVYGVERFNKGSMSDLGIILIKMWQKQGLPVGEILMRLTGLGVNIVYDNKDNQWKEIKRPLEIEEVKGPSSKVMMKSLNVDSNVKLLKEIKNAYRELRDASEKGKSWLRTADEGVHPVVSPTDSSNPTPESVIGNQVETGSVDSIESTGSVPPSADGVIDNKTIVEGTNMQINWENLAAVSDEALIAVGLLGAVTAVDDFTLIGIADNPVLVGSLVTVGGVLVARLYIANQEAIEDLKASGFDVIKFQDIKTYLSQKSTDTDNPLSLQGDTIETEKIKKVGLTFSFKQTDNGCSFTLDLTHKKEKFTFTEDSENPCTPAEIRSKLYQLLKYIGANWDSEMWDRWGDWDEIVKPLAQSLYKIMYQRGFK